MMLIQLKLIRKTLVPYTEPVHDCLDEGIVVRRLAGTIAMCNHVMRDVGELSVREEPEWLGKSSMAVLDLHALHSRR